MMTTLDVGSGRHPRGDVNLERYYPLNRHHRGKTCKPTIIADAHALPFKDRAFETVYCIHTLEHLTSPYVALKEIYRTLQQKGRLEIELPEVVNIG